MKGLVLKDIFGVRFQMLGALALMLLPSLMLMLMGGGMAVEEGETVPIEISLLIYGVVNYISITLCSSFLVNTLEYDERSGWSKMQRTMPITGGKIIGAKFAAMGLVLAALTVLSLIFNAVSALLFDIPLEPMLALPLAMCMVQATALSPTFSLGYRFGAKATTAAYIGIMVALAALMIWLIFLIFSGDINAAALRVICYAGLPVLTAAVVAASWVTGKKAVMVDI
ncbi:MAG: ABC-2 transporter permease [Lachnospiraceae bacterium]|nr:ABC-2 transporter permease [Ruminococcus sp.]MCM1275351.1 ABC-2 transporter permease [Lachnospiraceae bacterium]